MFIYYLISLLILGLDQWTKYLTIQHIAMYEVKELINGVLSLTYIRNSGAAMSILEGKMVFFYVVTLIVVIGVVYTLHKYGKNQRLFSTALAFILGGAIGNFIDRLLYQSVVDMIRIEFISFPIFNVADLALTIGVGLMILHVLFDEYTDNKNKQHALDKEE